MAFSIPDIPIPEIPSLCNALPIDDIAAKLTDALPSQLSGLAPDIKDFKVVSKRKPNQNQIKNLIFAFNICRYVKSNAIVLATNETTAGIGSGQPSRLDSCQIAIDKMNKFVKIKDEVVAASDAFFPFVDGIEKLVQSGVTAVIQPSGSIRDKEIIKFANETNTILIFSKTRHFRH